MVFDLRSFLVKCWDLEEFLNVCFVSTYLQMSCEKMYQGNRDKSRVVVNIANSESGGLRSRGKTKTMNIEKTSLMVFDLRSFLVSFGIQRGLNVCFVSTY